MEVVLGSSCEEAGSTDGVNIAARHTHTHTGHTREATQMFKKSTNMFIQLYNTKAHTTRTHCALHTFLTFSPLHHWGSHDHTAESQMKTSIWPHINNLMHYLQTSSPLSRITLSRRTIRHPDPDPWWERTAHRAERSPWSWNVLFHRAWCFWCWRRAVVQNDADWGMTLREVH